MWEKEQREKGRHEKEKERDIRVVEGKMKGQRKGEMKREREKRESNQ